MLDLLNEEHARASNELKLSGVTAAKVNSLSGVKDDNGLKSIVHALRVHYAKRKCDNSAREVQAFSASIRNANLLPVNDTKEEILEHEQKERKNPYAVNMFRTGDMKCNVTENLNEKHSNKRNACATTDKLMSTVHTRDRNGGKFSDVKVRRNEEPKHKELNEDLKRAVAPIRRKE